MLYCTAQIKIDIQLITHTAARVKDEKDRQEYQCVLWPQESAQGRDPDNLVEASSDYLYRPRQHAHGLNSKAAIRVKSSERKNSHYLYIGCQWTVNQRMSVRFASKLALVVMKRSSLFTSPLLNASASASPTSASFL